MSLPIRECTSCYTPVKQVFCSHVVVEDEFCFVPGIIKPEKVEVEPLFETLKVEFVLCDLVVVCGVLRKKISFPECTNLPPIVHDFTFQAHIPAHFNNTTPIYPNNIKVTAAVVVNGCYKLLCPSVNGSNTIYHKIKEKDVVAVQVTYTP